MAPAVSWWRVRLCQAVSECSTLTMQFFGCPSFELAPRCWLHSCHFSHEVLLEPGSGPNFQSYLSLGTGEGEGYVPTSAPILPYLRWPWRTVARAETCPGIRPEPQTGPGASLAPQQLGGALAKWPLSPSKKPLEQCRAPPRNSGGVRHALPASYEAVLLW